jgi:hypothetical protein
MSVKGSPHPTGSLLAASLKPPTLWKLDSLRTAAGVSGLLT